MNPKAQNAMIADDSETLRRKLYLLQDRYRDVIRLSSEMFWETNADFEVCAVSDCVLDGIGLHSSQLTGRTLFDVFAIVEEEPKNQKLIQAICRCAPFKGLHVHYHNANGSLSHFRLSGLPYFHEQTGAFAGYRGTALDITTEITALDSAKRLDQRLHSSLEAIPVAVSIFSQEGILIHINRSFADLFPETARLFFDNEEITYQNLFAQMLESAEILMAEDEQFAFFENIMEICGTRAACVSLPFEVEMSDNRWVKGHHIITESGDRIFIAQEVTDVKNRELMLSAARDMAEASHQTKAHFLANMSHELRTPLNAIMGFAELMASEALGPMNHPDYKGYAEDVWISAEHLLNLINDILDMSKIEAGYMTLSLGHMDVYEICSSVVRMLTQQAQQKKIHLILRDKDLPTIISGDKNKVQQMLVNLVGNAIKFTPEGGIVTLSLTENHSQELVVSVQDTGVGIKPENIHKILLPFEQIDNSETGKHKGTGLGLPLTKSLIEMHDGRLNIESVFGHGTTISLVFPKKIRIMGESSPL
ncbi:MAG: PAS domain-containing sensor histidine kinase [Alphaproteobacteria bacterium]